MFSVLSCRSANLLRCCYGQMKPSLRSIAGFKKLRPSSSILSKSHYEIIYVFPYIKILIPILRTHRWVPALSISACPLLYYLDETKTSIFITVLSASIYFLLGIPISRIANIIGKIYITKEGKIKDVLISSIDGSGRRVDRIHNIEDVINSDVPSAVARRMGFITLDVKDSDICYLLNIRDGKFFNEEAFNYILGINFHDINGNENDVKDNKKKELEG